MCNVSTGQKVYNKIATFIQVHENIWFDDTMIVLFSNLLIMFIECLVVYIHVIDKTKSIKQFAGDIIST